MIRQQLLLHFALLFTVCFAVNPIPALADWPAPFFYDDFEDGNAVDNQPVSWTPPDPLEINDVGTREVIGGHYVVTPPDELIPGGDLRSAGSWPSGAIFGDVSIRTQVTASEPGRNWIAMWARNIYFNDDKTEWADLEAGIRADGRLVLYMTQGQFPIRFTVYGDVQTGLATSDEPVNLQFDLFNDDAAVTVWRVGESKPTNPTLSAQIPGLLGEPGDVGLSFSSYDTGPGPSQSVGYYAALPTPWATLVRGDFNEDLTVDAADIDELSGALRTGTTNLKYDITLDNEVSELDRQYWVKDEEYTYFGDADLNGLFDSTDLVQVLAAGEYEDAVAGNSGWASGDFDGDGDFTSSDLVTALADGGYEQGPRAAASAVPEPSGVILLIVPILAVASRVRRPAN
jgi:hypothetical protein